MREFGSLEGFGAFLGTLTLEPGIHHALEQIGQAVEQQAQAEMGVYQQAVGPFSAWPELADSTKADRVAQGYTENDPLRRSGALAASITNVVDTVALAHVGAHVAAGEVVIGSEAPVMLYQEVGTPKIPPRPVLGPAVIHQEPMIKQAAGIALAEGLLPDYVGRLRLDYKRQI